jgi:plastocyanin
MFTTTLGFAFVALPAALAATFDVSVGAGGQFAFDPPSITAAPGDMVNFVLYAFIHGIAYSR